MILYHRTWTKRSAAILQDGFHDGDEGFVWLNNTNDFAIEVKAGEGGDVILKIDVPDDVVAAFPSEDRVGGWKAHKIPAERLNMCPRPEVAETLYSGMNRPELLQMAQQRQAQENAGQQTPKGLQTAAQLFEAIAFFDSHITYR